MLNRDFVVWATKDAASANLQKLQIVKGWADADGQTFEQVYDVVCTDGLEPDPQTRRCADNGARVDLTNCSYSRDIGAEELSTTWSDPSFNRSQRAFYYVRVLENPTLPLVDPLGAGPGHLDPRSAADQGARVELSDLVHAAMTQ